MSGHTPGPWFVSAAYGDKSALWIGPAKGPAMVLQGANCLRSDSVLLEQIGIDQLAENAALISAAPMLLDALESVWLWMENQADGQSKGGHATFDLMMLREQRDIARAAIAKATGGAA